MNLERIATTASRLLALLREGSVEIAARDPETEQQVAQTLADIERALDEANATDQKVASPLMHVGGPLNINPDPTYQRPPLVTHQPAPDLDRRRAGVFGLIPPRQTVSRVPKPAHWPDPPPPPPAVAAKPATARICTHCAHHRQGAGPSGMQQHDCLHDACRHPVTGSPLDCRIARAAPRAPNDIHGLEFCGPHARHFEPRPQEA
jgi:hypothetical protein